VGGVLRLAAVPPDRGVERAGAPVVQVRRRRRHAPQRLGAELAAGRLAHAHAVGEIGPQVVQEQVGVGGDRPPRPAQAGGVAVVASELVKQPVPALGHGRERLRRRRRGQHREAHEIEQVLPGQLRIGGRVFVGQRRVRRGGLRDVHQPPQRLGGRRAAARVDGEPGALLVRQRVRRDAGVVLQRPPDEALDRHRLGLHAEPSDEPAVVVRPAADAVAVAVVGVGAGQDLGLRQLCEQAHAEERDGVALREPVRGVRDRGPAVLSLPVMIDSKDAFRVTGRQRREVPAGRVDHRGQVEVPIQAGRAADDWLLVA
jgi:hypothetical protein